MVASGESVTKVRDGTNSLRQVAQQIGGDDWLFAEMTRGDFSGQSVEIHGGGGGAVEILRELRGEAGGHPGEDVAGAAGRHSGRAGGVDPGAAVSERNDGTFTFQD